MRIKNRLKKIKTVQSINELNTRTKEYKKYINKTSAKYYKQLHKDLRNLKKNKPKDYWDILNKASSSNKRLGNIALKSLVKH